MYGLQPKGPGQENVHTELVELCVEPTQDRALIEATRDWHARRGVDRPPAPVRFVGGVVRRASRRTPLGALVAGVLAGTFVTLMILLRTPDRLRWHNGSRSGSPTTRLFRSIGKDPYVPAR
jgi:hypothetical protein